MECLQTSIINCSGSLWVRSFSYSTDERLFFLAITHEPCFGVPGQISAVLTLVHHTWFTLHTFVGMFPRVEIIACVIHDFYKVFVPDAFISVARIDVCLTLVFVLVTNPVSSIISEILT